MDNGGKNISGGAGEGKLDADFKGPLFKIIRAYLGHRYFFYSARSCLCPQASGYCQSTLQFMEK